MDIERRLPRVDELDGLRGLLAGWVAVSHVLCWCGFSTVGLPEPYAGSWREFVLAMPAVETFMILSGFAISFLLDSREQSYPEFLRGRFFRIYPTYLACLLLGVATVFLTSMVLDRVSWHRSGYFQRLGTISRSERGDLVAHVIAHLTLLNGLIPAGFLADADSTLLPPGWSITLEWQYYLVAPFIALATRKGWLMLVVAGVAAWGVHDPHLWRGSLSFLPAQLGLFLVGIGSFHLYAHLVRSGGARASTPAVLVAGSLAASWIAAWHVVALTIWAVAFGSVLVEGSGGFEGVFRGVRRLLLHPAAQGLGRISYPLYLVHWPMIVAWLWVLVRVRPAIGRAEALAWMIAAGLPSILLASWLLHKCIEAPMMRLGRPRPGK